MQLADRAVGRSGPAVGVGVTDLDLGGRRSSIVLLFAKRHATCRKRRSGRYAGHEGTPAGLHVMLPVSSVHSMHSPHAEREKPGVSLNQDRGRPERLETLAPRHCPRKQATKPDELRLT